MNLDPNSGNHHANLGKRIIKTQLAISYKLSFLHKGVVYHLRKDYKRAEKSYSRALTLEPNLALARENFNKLMSVSESL